MKFLFCTFRSLTCARQEPEGISTRPDDGVRSDRSATPKLTGGNPRHVADSQATQPRRSESGRCLPKAATH